MDDFSFVEGLESVAVNCRVMHKNIGIGFLLKDRPKSLFVVEPFYLPAGHRTPVSRYYFKALRSMRRECFRFQNESAFPKTAQRQRQKTLRISGECNRFPIGTSSQLEVFHSPKKTSETFLFRPALSAFSQLQMRPRVRNLQTQIDVKRAEFPISSAHFVKAHFIDDFLQRIHLMRQQSHPPLPIIQARRPRD